MKLRPRSTISVLLLTLIAATASATPQSSTGSDTRDLTRLEKVWNDAHEQGNADALEPLWADDMEIDVPRMPAMTRADALKFAHSGRMKFLHYATSDLRIRIYGDTAVVTGRLQRTRTMNGQELSDDWRFTKVYIRQTQSWRVVSFHASEAGP
jgi:ketosteroid isomerase-like protein